MNLEGQNIVVFDLEVKNLVDGINIRWSDKHLMGISVGCLYDFRDGDYKVYMDDNIGKVGIRLAEADLVVGFNIIEFDIPLIDATLFSLHQPVPLTLCVYDILAHSREATGLGPRARFAKGLRLDDHLEGTFGIAHKKTGDGAAAPALWQSGKIGELVSYCLADVKREKMLFEHIWHGWSVKTALHGERICADPRPFMRVIEAKTEVQL